MNTKYVIAIIGAGFAGINAAKTLEKLLFKRISRDDDIEILLIDKHPYQTMITCLHEVATERVSTDAILLDLKSMFKKRGIVKIITDTITSINTKEYCAIGQKAEYYYDYLILCSGCRTSYFNVPGAKEFSYNLRYLDEAIQLNSQIRMCFQKASFENDSEKRKKLLSFFITGAGFTGVELAGDMAEWFPSLCREYEVSRDDVSISIVDMLPRPAAVLPEKLSKKVEKRLKKLNVNCIFGASVSEVTDKSISYVVNGQINTTDTCTVIWTAGIEGADIISEVQNASLGRGRRIMADSKLRMQGIYGAFVCGDNISIPAGKGVIAPQTVENAEQSGVLCGKSAAAFIDGRTDKFKNYCFKTHGCMVSVGSKYCVSQILLGGRIDIGDFTFTLPTIKLAPPSFFSMTAKHGVNMLYIFKNCGIRRVSNYIMDEFIRTNNGRSYLSLKNPVK